MKPPRAPPRSTWIPAFAGTKGAASLLGVTFIAAIGLGLVLKLITQAGGPLWLDEGWTLGIVARPGWAAYVEQLRLDVNPPLYFLVMRGWTALAGLSNAALRAPSVLFAALCPLAVLLGRPPLTRSDRWAWAAMLGLMPASIYFAQEARGYALLLLLETGAAVAFLRLMDRPGRGRAAAWCALTALALLTHYHALIVGGLQGLAFLAVHRKHAVRCWPAALLFLPWLAWALPHAPRVLAFARPEYAWYAVLPLSSLPVLLNFLTGGTAALWIALLIAGRLAEARLAAHGVEPAPGARSPETWTALVALAAAGMVIGLGLLKPSFTPRYLVPDVPGLALGLVVGLRAAGPRAAPALGAALAALLAAIMTVSSLKAETADRRAYGIEAASADLMRANVQRLVFLWDNPTDGVLAPPERAALADAFFVRNGRRVAVVDLAYAPTDPNPRLLAALPPGGGLLWLWDVRVPRTAAIRFPPTLASAEGVSCRTYAGGAVGVLACVRAPARWR